MVLHAVRNWLAAVRAHLLQDQEMLITATRMLCGQVHLPQVAVYYYVYDYRNGSFYNPFGIPGHVSTFAVSVRCVLDLETLQTIGLQLCDANASSFLRRCTVQFG